jgi:hypothetical protein
MYSNFLLTFLSAKFSDIDFPWQRKLHFNFTSLSSNEKCVWFNKKDTMEKLIKFEKVIMVGN